MFLSRCRFGLGWIGLGLVGLRWIAESVIVARVGMGTGIFFLFVRVRSRKRRDTSKNATSTKPLHQAFSLEHHRHDFRSPQGDDPPSDDSRPDRGAVNRSNGEWFKL